MLEADEEKGLVVVGVTQLYGFYKTERPLSPGAEVAKLPEFIKEFDLPWPLIVGPKSNSEEYGVNGIPQYVVIGRDGKVKHVTVGYNEELHKQLEAAVEKALSEPVAAR